MNGRQQRWINVNWPRGNLTACMWHSSKEPLFVYKLFSPFLRNQLTQSTHHDRHSKNFFKRFSLWRSLKFNCLKRTRLLQRKAREKRLHFFFSFRFSLSFYTSKGNINNQKCRRAAFSLCDTDIIEKITDIWEKLLPDRLQTVCPNNILDAWRK